MPNKTNNYKLTKPLPEEFYDVGVHNANMDIIDTELKNRATLDSAGQVPISQIPLLGYIPNTQKGIPNGVASLDNTGKVPSSQLPAMAGGSGKRTVRFTVGSSQYGWTESDCDYLCDGTADEAEINAAIQALRTTGGEIVLLDGRYNIASAILINKDNVTLTGNGANTKIIRAFNDDENDETLQGLIIVTSAYCTIKNLYIDDVKDNYIAYRTISLYSGTNCTIADNTLVNIGGDGIYVNSDNNTIDNNNVSGSGNSGINLNKSYKTIVTNNKVSGSAMYGIFAIRIGDGVINNNICTDNYNSGISLYWAERTSITGNASNNNGDCGFYVTRGSGNIVCGNTFVGNGAYGVTIQLYASNTMVMSNNIYDNASGDVNNKGENNTIYLPTHKHSGADITSGFDVLRSNLNVATIMNGTYKGTGTVSPVMLACGFKPLCIHIFDTSNIVSGTEFMAIILPDSGIGYSFNYGTWMVTRFSVTCTDSGNGTYTVSFNEMNVTGVNFHYVAIGE